MSIFFHSSFCLLLWLFHYKLYGSCSLLPLLYYFVALEALDTPYFYFITPLRTASPRDMYSTFLDEAVLVVAFFPTMLIEEELE